jgi:hypothetical protein
MPQSIFENRTRTQRNGARARTRIFHRIEYENTAVNSRFDWRIAVMCVQAAIETTYTDRSVPHFC